jgi:small-conductance mechanosensitive channel
MVTPEMSRALGAVQIERTPLSSDDTCSSDDTGVCGWVLDKSGGNETLAKAADWFIGRPLAILGILLAAWIGRTIARWAIRRGVRRIMMPPAAFTRGLGALSGSTQATGVAEEIELARRRSRAESIGSALAGVVTVTIWVIAGAAIANQLGLDVTTLLASAGLIGVALGFGAQSLVRDCITGLFMLIEDQYGIGDEVDVGSASGTVEKVSLRTTVLRGLDGTVWHVPNGEIKRVGNQSKLWSMAVVDVDVAPDVDLNAAREHLLRAAAAVCAEPQWAMDVLAEPRVLGVESIRAEAVTLRLVVKTSPGRQWELQRALREAIKSELDARHVSHTMPSKASPT